MTYRPIVLHLGIFGKIPNHDHIRYFSFSFCLEVKRDLKARLRPLIIFDQKTVQWDLAVRAAFHKVRLCIQMWSKQHTTRDYAKKQKKISSEKEVTVKKRRRMFCPLRYFHSWRLAELEDQKKRNSFCGSNRLKQRFRWCSISPIQSYFLHVISSGMEGLASCYWLESLIVICIKHLSNGFSLFIHWNVDIKRSGAESRRKNRIKQLARHTSFGERLSLLILIGC